MSHCQRGDEYIVGQMAHTYRWEGGGARGARQHPAAAARRTQADGTLALADIEAAIKPDDAHFARDAGCSASRTRSAARCCRSPTCEAATRSRSGAAWRPTSTARACSTPRSRSAAIRARRRARSRAPFDSVSVCFSKGLGAPVGSALVGSREFIARRAPRAQDARRRHAPGRRARRRGAARARSPHRPPRRRPRHATRLADGLARLPGIDGRARRRPTSSSPTCAGRPRRRR